ncbi:hypothetical protein HPB48_007890 [Haemaphysalis longicornis]|uniref:Uncharacterized protein n=1 Tax=Haemaphysalis longicornis TaxID=44386 RepID=A0A9J6GXQ7_HAELO|nr:hypothetical protein HPB48_007890 [Haemaphysalis longicornis]
MNVSGVWFDIKDLYYSLPHELLMEVVSEEIDKYGSVPFENDCGVSVDGLLELLSSYLQSSILEFEGAYY